MACGDPVLTVMNPPVTQEIKINVKTGTAGHTALKGLEKLYNITGVFDVSMSWEEAFKRHYNVHIDSTKFSIQKKSQRGVPTTKHNIREEISLLMREFKAVRPVFTVYVVENKLRVNNVAEPRPVRLLPVRLGAGDLSLQGSGRVVHVDVDFPGDNAGREGKRRAFNVNNQKNAALVDNSNGSAKIKRPWNGTNAAKGSAKATATSGQNGNSNTGNHGQFPWLAAHNAMGSESRSPAETVLIPSPPEGNGPVYKFDDQFFRLQRGPPNANGPRVEVVDQNVTVDDEDATSDITAASQDSQMGDLKGAFYNRATRNVSNTQFLMAKHELEALKKKNWLRWGNWAITAPITSNIIRDLFNL